MWFLPIFRIPIKESMNSWASLVLSHLAGSLFAGDAAAQLTCQ
jgi:hypothetical protein